MLAERLHISVFELENAPADRVLFYRELLYVEGEMSRALHGLSPDEPLIMDFGDED